MSLLSGRVRWGNVALALAVIAPLTAVTLTGPLAVTVEAAHSAYPACQASRIRVTAGATLINTIYNEGTPKGIVKSLANEAVPLYFYNKGTTCHLLMGAPSFRAVRNSTDVGTLTIRDFSFPVGADNENRLVLDYREKVEALFVVVTSKLLVVPRCDPATTTGLLVGDYANPIATTHFIARTLRKVCFDSGLGRDYTNSGAVWVPTH
jgi:hypothetical protein